MKTDRLESRFEFKIILKTNLALDGTGGIGVVGGTVTTVGSGSVELLKGSNTDVLA